MPTGPAQPARAYLSGYVRRQQVRVIGQVRLTAFFGVPQVWEKIRVGIEALLAAEQGEGKRAAAAQAMDTGRRYVHSCQYGQATPPELAAQYRAADERVLRSVRGLLGLGEAVSVFSAAAPLPPDVAAFFAGLGMMIFDIYASYRATLSALETPSVRRTRLPSLCGRNRSSCHV